MIWVRSAPYCEGGVVDLTNLASSRSTFEGWGGGATVVFQKRLGGDMGSERSGPWLDGGCIVCRGIWGCGVEF